MGAAIRTIAFAFALFAGACSLPPPAIDTEAEGFAIRALIAKNPADQIDADHARMRIIRTLEIAPAGDTAHVEGEYLVAPKQGQQGLASWQGKFVIEAKKTGDKWAIVTDDIQPPKAP
jgi:ketosteroid isomerase-like protein